MVEFSHAGDDRCRVCTRDYLQIHLQLPLHIHTLLLSVVFDESQWEQTDCWFAGTSALTHKPQGMKMFFGTALNKEAVSSIMKAAMFSSSQIPTSSVVVVLKTNATITFFLLCDSFVRVIKIVSCNILIYTGKKKKSYPFTQCKYYG